MEKITVEQILDSDLSFKECSDKIFSLPYFRHMRKDLGKCIDSDDIQFLVNMMRKHGVRSWTFDFFSKHFLEKHFEKMNEVVVFHCEQVDRDLSMFKYPVRCVEFSILYNILINQLIVTYKPEKREKREVKDRQAVVKIKDEVFDFSF